MVNGPSPDQSGERRARPRPVAAHAAVLGQSKELNPFGDLHALQHLSARFARSLKTLFEPMLRHELRSWAEPLAVQRFADYRAERPDTLTGWLPLAVAPGEAQALCVLDGRFVLELLDLFFGGAGHAPAELPAEFTPAAEALAARIAGLLAGPLAAAWEPLAPLAFRVGAVETQALNLHGVDGDEAMVVTRFGIAAGSAKPAFIDLLYPVAALKPYAPSLTGKVVAPAAHPDPAWRQGLTRAAMGVRFTVRSVLAEPVVPLSMLMNLKPGDVIPIGIAADVPVMVGRDRLGTGTVGVSNGRAAVRLTALHAPSEILK